MDFKLKHAQTTCDAAHDDGNENDDGVLWKKRGGMRHVKYPLSSIAPAVPAAPICLAWPDMKSARKCYTASTQQNVIVQNYEIHLQWQL